MKTVTVVVPMLNEGPALPRSIPAILAALGEVDGIRADLVIVDDGSSDADLAVAHELALGDERVSVLGLARHFGKEAAIDAGLAHSRSDATIVMDADLQHPPGLLPEMVRLWLAGAMVVEGVKRSRGPESWLSRVTAALFYRLFRALSELDIHDHTDFKLLDRSVVAAYLALPERRRFFRGLVRWLAFPSAQIPFDVPPRVSGRQAFGAFKRLRLSVAAITAFSSAPLHLITGLGGVAFALGVVIGGIALRDKLTGGAVDGFTTVILLLLILGGLIMVGLGLVGLYLAHIFDEVKGRPTYRIAPDRSVLHAGGAHEAGVTPAHDAVAGRAGVAPAGSISSLGVSDSPPSGDR